MDSHHYFKLFGGVRLTEVVVSHYCLKLRLVCNSGKVEIHTNSFDLLYALGVNRVFASLTEWDWCESAGY